MPVDGRRLTPAGATNGGGRSLGGSMRQPAHLESILQQLAQHETRTTAESVERTSAITQQRLLKSQLLQAQEELATALTSKATLCEEVGSLQRAAVQYRKEVAQYKTEVVASREAQAALARKVSELEESARSMKRQYIKSLDCRMQTAAKLLSRLQFAKSTPSPNDLDVSRDLSERCSEWVGSDPNKRKRVLSDDANEVRLLTNPAQTETSPTSVDSAHRFDGSVPQVEPMADCGKCADIKVKFNKERDQLIQKVARLESEHTVLDNNHRELLQKYATIQASGQATTEVIKAKDAEIADLKRQMANMLSTPQAQVTEESKEDSGSSQATLELENQIKLLEENLNQMNGYADQLELVISQCPSCTIKLQTESTQDSVVKQ